MSLSNIDILLSIPDNYSFFFQIELHDAFIALKIEKNISLLNLFNKAYISAFYTEDFFVALRSVLPIFSNQKWIFIHWLTQN